MTIGLIPRFSHTERRCLLSDLLNINKIINSFELSAFSLLQLVCRRAGEEAEAVLLNL